jgi:hypothetical protein
MSKQLPLTFFRRPAASVAREMIGATIAREDDHGIRRFTILETKPTKEFTTSPLIPRKGAPHEPK